MNDYALGFPVPLPGNVSQMEFTWQNLLPQQPLSYKIDTTTDNAEAMAQPTLDIPLNGKLVSTNAKLSTIGNRPELSELRGSSLMLSSEVLTNAIPE